MLPKTVVLLAAVGLPAACKTPEKPVPPVPGEPQAESNDPPAKPDPPGDADPRGEANLSKIQLPDGFHIQMYAADVPGARSMALSPNGTLFVGTRNEGKVYAIVDKDGDHRADEVKTIARGLDMPNGVAFRDGDLYVAEISKIWRYPDIEKHLDDPPKPTLVSDAFPDKRAHGWKYINFGPDGKLYVPVGAPCNICKPDFDDFGNIQRMDPDGSHREVFATGIRNSVGFDWNPTTGVLWFTDNGRDRLGDNKPPDELNRAPKAGLNFGYPYCYDQGVPDPQFAGQKSCTQFVSPALDLGPHVAALGMEFYRGKMFPKAYQNQIFIAEHGSWNRTHKIGYRVMLVHVDANGNATGKEPFATGWLQGESDWGRPVDVEVMDDGSLLVSDDEAGHVYRITYGQ